MVSILTHGYGGNLIDFQSPDVYNHLVQETSGMYDGPRVGDECQIGWDIRGLKEYAIAIVLGDARDSYACSDDFYAKLKLGIWHI